MLEERLAEIRAELNSFDDDFLKYSFLVELSAYVPADQPDLMRDEYLHRGCQSRVWVRLGSEGGAFRMRATSDTLIIRGVLYVMSELFNGVPVGEIADADLDFLEACGIAEHFSDARATGIQSIADAVLTYCRRQAGTGEAG
jgi:cysteine desulfuration protein SufE